MHLLTRCSSNTKQPRYEIPWGIPRVVWKNINNHCTISQDHLEANKLIQWIMQTMKWNKTMGFKIIVLDIEICGYHG